jgi:3-phosphoshikimate 1-carboxyvinyltransferase
LDLAAVPLLHHLTHLPVIVDPSHAPGRRWLVEPWALAGDAAGADGVMVEVHPRPEEALSDGEQSLTLEQFRSMMSALEPIHAQVRHLHGDPLPSPSGARGGRHDRALSAAATRPATEGGSRGTTSAQMAVIRRAPRLRGELRMPGDKSISHRALILAALAEGNSSIQGASDGADVRSTAAIVGALGAEVERLQEDGRTVDYRVVSPGVDGLREPGKTLDCGNSGTSLRLFAGLLAGMPFRATLDGDESLRRRPVARIIEPLRAMGAELSARSNDSLPPLTVLGRTPLRAIDVTTAVPSAQVKSAILLAALRAEGRSTVRESVATRDHTERMLRARGVPVERQSDEGSDEGVAWSLTGGWRVRAVDEQIPGDVSAAAFWLVAGAIHPDAELTVRSVGVNPTRRAVIDLLRRMGARIEETPALVGAGAADGDTGEPMADLLVRSSRLEAIEIAPAEVAAAIDEIPVLCLAATQAAGTTVIRGAGELRKKESDRIAGIAAGLSALGAHVQVVGDDLHIAGGARLTGAPTDSLDDHRLAMTFEVAGLLADGETTVLRANSATISYPGFLADLEGVRA